MSLSNYSTEQLLAELSTRSAQGVASLNDSQAGRIEVWWGGRSTCLGYATRLQWNINQEMDEVDEDEEDADPEEDAEEGLDALAREFPQPGQYL